MFAALAVPLQLAAQVDGSGTTDFVPRWTDSTTQGNSNISDIGGVVAVIGKNGTAASPVSPARQCPGCSKGYGRPGWRHAAPRPCNARRNRRPYFFNIRQGRKHNQRCRRPGCCDSDQWRRRFPVHTGQHSLWACWRQWGFNLVATRSRRKRRGGGKIWQCHDCNRWRICRDSFNKSGGYT